MIVYLLSVILVLWYMKFRSKRRRMYELVQGIHSPPGLTAVIGIVKHTYNATNLVFPLLKEYSEYAFANGIDILKIWVGPMLYVAIIDPKDVASVLKNHLEKEPLQSLLRAILGNSSIFGPVHIWARRRKLLVPAFTPKRLNIFTDILVNQSETLVQRLVEDNRVGTGRFGIWSYINAYTLSSVAETTLGIKLEAQRNPHLPFLTAVNRTLVHMTKRMLNVWLWPDCIYRLSGTFREQEKCKEIFNKLTDEIIQKRREALKNIDINEYNNSLFGHGSDKVLSFLDLLIIQCEEERKITDTELREEVLVLLLAGTDTSAVGISNTIKLLGMYPDVQDRVYTELMNVLGDSNRRLQKGDLQDLTYLHRVVKESLRLFPPGPIIARQINEETTLPSGLTLPEGTNVVVPIWAIHRNPKVWGTNANCFDPDRFLSDDSGLFMPFSLGPRNCVGYQYALMVVKIVLATLLRNFRVVGEACGPIPHIDCTYSIMLRAKDDYQVRLERR